MSVVRRVQNIYLYTKYYLVWLAPVWTPITKVSSKFQFGLEHLIGVRKEPYQRLLTA